MQNLIISNVFKSVTDNLSLNCDKRPRTRLF